MSHPFTMSMRKLNISYHSTSFNTEQLTLKLLYFDKRRHILLFDDPKRRGLPLGRPLALLGRNRL
jgi:hypothetical protein